MEQRRRLYLTVLVLAVGYLASEGVWAQVVTMWDWEVPSLPSKVNAVVYHDLGCYDLYWGTLVNCDISVGVFYDCTWTSPDNYLWYSGGHIHPAPCGSSSGRPLVSLDCDIPPGFHAVSAFQGETGRARQWPLKVTMPQASGVNSISVQYEFPPFYGSSNPADPRWSYAQDPNDPTRVIATAVVGVDVGLGGLSELPAEPDHYIRCGIIDGCTEDSPTSDEQHPAVFFATGEMIRAVQETVFDFLKDYPNRRLRISDMSLPQGGLCDYKHNWTKPHVLHRLGRSMDVDPHYVNGVVVDDDTLDAIAMGYGLTRKEKDIGLIHYELGE